jgi:ABC-type transport system involved in cytochrome bd biosynthesis fused ATPase/permease subunit
MEIIWQFIRDNWIIVTGGIAAIVTAVAVPAFRAIAVKAFQAAALNIGKAIMSMLTAEALTRALIWALRKLAKKTAGDWDDILVEKLDQALHGKKVT